MDNTIEQNIDNMIEQNMDNTIEQNIDNTIEQNIDIITEQNMDNMIEQNIDIITEPEIITQNVDIITEPEIITQNDEMYELQYENNINGKKIKNYNTDFKCTYQAMDNLEDSENLYRIQFLQAFNTSKWDSNIIDNTIQTIYSLLNKYKYGIKILKSVNLNVSITNFIANSDIYILFSYDYFYAFHDCICDIANIGYITDINYNYLIEQINNKK
jgi:hypothetical protein